LPGRAVKNTEFTQKILKGKAHIEKCDSCLRKCTRSFCIIQALISAQQGDVENGIVFSGSNGWRVSEVVSTEEVINALAKEIDDYLESEKNKKREEAS